jgi:hypothetical protein
VAYGGMFVFCEAVAGGFEDVFQHLLFLWAFQFSQTSLICTEPVI